MDLCLLWWKALKAVFVYARENDLLLEDVYWIIHKEVEKALKDIPGVQKFFEEAPRSVYKKITIQMLYGQGDKERAKIVSSQTGHLFEKDSVYKFSFRIAKEYPAAFKRLYPKVSELNELLQTLVVLIYKYNLPFTIVLKEDPYFIVDQLYCKTGSVSHDAYAMMKDKEKNTKKIKRTTVIWTQDLMGRRVPFLETLNKVNLAEIFEARRKKKRMKV